MFISRRKRIPEHLVYIYGRTELHTGFWLEILNEREQLEDVRVAGKIILKRMLKQ